MAKDHPRFTKRTSIWLAWVGFNLSHSLGCIIFGAFVVILGRDGSTFNRNAFLAVPFSLLVALLFTGLAAKYWFKTPLRGCILSTACFLISWVLHLTA